MRRNRFEDTGGHGSAEITRPVARDPGTDAELHTSESGVNESEASYRTLIENSLTGICVQQDGLLSYVNQRFADIFGYSREELIGLRLWELVAPEHSDLVKQRHIERLAGKEPIKQYEITIVTRDGGKKYLAVWFSLIRHGGRAGILGNVVDITELKQAQEAVKESEQHFRTLFESAPDSIFTKNLSLRYTHVNPAMQDLLGMPEKELVGKTDIELFGRRVGSHLKRMESRVLSGEPLAAQHTRTLQGIPTAFHEIRVPMRNSAGEIVGVYGISRNITDLKRGLAPPRASSSSEAVSAVMQATLATARTAAKKDGIILILGESGVGKDYLARYIHQHSERRDGPFFAMNCAALPPDLAESELFGHEPGAFTGATGRKRGLLELAEGGTLLLNEIGDLSLPLQAKLLTFLDTRSFTRLGGERSIAVNARLVAATNKDLVSDVTQGRFRHDLYYRINVLAIRVPPLRERREDIPGLVDHIMTELVGQMQLPHPPALDSNTLSILKNYRWPGNVRELRNVLERGLMLWEGGPLRLTVNAEIAVKGESLCNVRFPNDQTLHDVTDEVIRTLCTEALRRAAGSKKRAADLLGISRNSLYRYMKRLGLLGDSGTYD